MAGVGWYSRSLASPPRIGEDRRPAGGEVSLDTQIIGILAIGTWAGGTACIIFSVIKWLGYGVCSTRDQRRGQDAKYKNDAYMSSAGVTRFKCFLSHHKMDRGSYSRLLQLELAQFIDSRARIFLDSDNLVRALPGRCATGRGDVRVASLCFCGAMRWFGRLCFLLSWLCCIGSGRGSWVLTDLRVGRVETHRRDTYVRGSRAHCVGALVGPFAEVNLDTLMQTVREKTDMLIVVESDVVFWRPWVIGEITQASMAQVPMLFCVPHTDDQAAARDASVPPIDFDKVNEMLPEQSAVCVFSFRPGQRRDLREFVRSGARACRRLLPETAALFRSGLLEGVSFFACCAIFPACVAAVRSEYFFGEGTRRTRTTSSTCCSRTACSTRTSSRRSRRWAVSSSSAWTGRTRRSTRSSSKHSGMRRSCSTGRTTLVCCRVL